MPSINELAEDYGIATGTALMPPYSREPPSDLREFLASCPLALPSATSTSRFCAPVRLVRVLQTYVDPAPFVRNGRGGVNIQPGFSRWT